jgi:hypothetical protein
MKGKLRTEAGKKGNSPGFGDSRWGIYFSL